MTSMTQEKTKTEEIIPEKKGALAVSDSPKSTSAGTSEPRGRSSANPAVQDFAGSTVTAPQQSQGTGPGPQQSNNGRNSGGNGNSPANVQHAQGVLKIYRRVGASCAMATSIKTAKTST